jgi:YbbR domain-containing protein
MTDRILTPVIAIGLAFLVWVYTRSRDQESMDNVPVPVELEINPSQAMYFEPLETGETRTVNVSFTGPPSRIRELRSMLHRGEVAVKLTVAVPEDRLNDAKYFDTLRIDPAQVPVPPGVATMITESQNRIPVTLWRVVEKQLPVRLVSDGENRIEQPILEPSTVLVRGRKEVIERLNEGVPTQQLVVSDKRNLTKPAEIEDSVPLAYEVLNGKIIRTTPASVKVRFTLKPVQSEKELTEVPVHFLCPANFPYQPMFVNERAGKISVRVLGPATEDRPLVTAYVDLTVRKFGPGLHVEEPLRIQMPPGFQLVGDPPRLSSFRLVPLDTPAKSNETPPGV